MTQEFDNSINKNTNVPNQFEQLKNQNSQSFSNEAHDAYPDSTEENPDADAQNQQDTDDGSEQAINAGMPPEARRALVSLLRWGVILATKKLNLFESICRYQAAIRLHLADVYLKLVLDEKAGIAFVTCIAEEDVEDDEPVSLITRRTLTLYDTLLLLVLRKHYQEREKSGEHRIIIDTERMESYLTPFLPLTNSTKADRKKLTAATKRMVEKRLLTIVRGSDDRFEITPIIRYVVSAAFLESLLEEYLQLATKHGVVLTEADSNAQP